MYHAIGVRTAKQDPDNLFVPPENFAAQLQVLADRALRPVSVQDHVAGRAGRGDVVITFDDAYVSTLEAAAPQLRERGWPAAVYVCSGLLGGTSHWNADPLEPLLDADGVLELVRLGWTVGAHSRTHPDLRGLPAPRLEAEVKGSRDDLGDLLGSAPATFTYPFGHQDGAARAAVAAAGYGLGYAVHRGHDVLSIARVDVNATDSARTFALKLRRGYPLARRVLGLAPPLRRAVHRVAGAASR